MQKVNAYITYNFKGNFAKGTGKAGIILELIDEEGIPHTRTHFCGYLGTTNNRLCILACINALEKFKKSCDIEIYIDSAYVENATPREWEKANWISSKNIKNKDLWQQYLALAKNHLVKIENVKSHPYTGVLELELRNREIDLKADIKK